MRIIYNVSNSVTQLRDVSRAMFGQLYKLELLLAIADAEDGIVCLTELSRSTGVTISSLQRPFESLVDAKLISPLPDADSKFRYYSRNPSALWGFARALAEQTELVDRA
jgi:DNA-binding transcriptional ArsR family regulator